MEEHREEIVRDEVVRAAPAPAPVTEYRSSRVYFGGDPAFLQFTRFMWYLLGLLEGLLAIRFLLALLAANQDNPFAGAIYAVTGAFVAPFRSLFATPAFGGSVFELYTLIAMIV